MAGVLRLLPGAEVEVELAKALRVGEGDPVLVGEVESGASGEWPSVEVGW